MMLYNCPSKLHFVSDVCLIRVMFCIHIQHIHVFIGIVLVFSLGLHCFQSSVHVLIFKHCRYKILYFLL